VCVTSATFVFNTLSSERAFLTSIQVTPLYLSKFKLQKKEVDSVA